MTDEPLDLAPIEARDAAVLNGGGCYTATMAERDRRALLAEVKRLRAQVIYWQGRAETAEDKLDGQAWLDLTNERNQLRAVVYALRSSVTEADDHPGMYDPQAIIAQLKLALNQTPPEETP